MTVNVEQFVINKRGMISINFPSSPWIFPTAFSSWGREEAVAIERVFSSGRFTMGEEVAAFEEEFAAWHRMKHGIMVNSGSSANLLMIATLFNLKRRKPLRRNDTAMVPALAWSTTYAPLVQHGLRLKLVDADASWCAALPDILGCQLVVGCSILGNPAPLNFLQTAADSYDAYFVEDNCESLGACFGERRTGTFGLMNSFSFFHSHQISAIEGGMVLTDDDECAALCRILRAHGWTRDVQKPLFFDEEYNFTHFGYNLRPLELHAAIAREQLKKLPVFIKERQSNELHFKLAAEKLPITWPSVRGHSHSPFGLPFTVKDSITRDKLVKALREKKIDCRLPTGGSFTRHAYGAPWRDNVFPVADRIHDTGMFLGNAPYPIGDLIDQAVQVMKNVL